MQLKEFMRQFAPSFLMLGIIVSMSSIVWTSDIARSKAELSSMSFGFPVRFFQADLSPFDPPYPYTMSYCGPWECKMQSFSLTSFGVNIFFFASLFAAISFLLFSLFPRAWPLAHFLAATYVLGALGTLMALSAVALLLLIFISGNPTVVQEQAGTVNNSMTGTGQLVSPPLK